MSGQTGQMNMLHTHLDCLNRTFFTPLSTRFFSPNPLRIVRRTIAAFTLIIIHARTMLNAFFSLFHSLRERERESGRESNRESSRGSPLIAIDCSDDSRVPTAASTGALPFERSEDDHTHCSSGVWRLTVRLSVAQMKTLKWRVRAFVVLVSRAV